MTATVELLPLTNQQAFAKIVTHLRQQNGRQSMAANGTSCRYRGEHHTMCAIGCLIPDQLYHIAMEGLSYTALVNTDEFPTIAGLFAQCSHEMLQHMQRIHDMQDCAYTGEDTPLSNRYRLAVWEVEWKKVAERWQLEIPPL